VAESVAEETVRKLREAGEAMGSLDPAEKDGKNRIVRVGVLLESVQREIASSAPECADLCRLALQGLQALYEGKAKEPTVVTDGASRALAAAVELIENSPVADGLAAEARALITRGIKGGVASIHDVAALLMQVEPDDNKGLADLLESVKALRKTSAPPAGETLDKVAGALGQMLEGDLPDRAGALVEVGKLLERLMDAPDGYPGGQPVEPEPSQSPVEAGEVAPMLPADIDLGLLAEFITESREYIQGAENALLALETNPRDVEAVSTVFRAFHTIKGTSAFMGLGLLSDLAHRAETLLSRIRDGEILYGGGYADLALESIDLLKELLTALEGCAPGGALAKPGAYDRLRGILADPEAAGYSSETSKGSCRPVVDASPPPPSAEGGGVPQGKTSTEAAGGHGVKAAETVRVSTDRLDRLLDMVGELVISHSMVGQDEIVNDRRHHLLLRKVNDTGKIVRELQDLSMSMRMVPLRATFQKMARLVRDLSHKSGKPAELVTDGGDTEMDRNMVDMISDPLVHMIRNSIDHGLEPTAIREQNRKPKCGTVKLSAYQAGGSVVIEVADDGKGLDREKILRKGMDRGLVTSADGLSESEILGLIFEPGFSTADKITDVSGRGVGLDVVKRNIDALRGRIDISSRPGEGCTFVMRLPLTMAIIDGMVVKVGDRRYIVPALSIVRSLRPLASQVSTVLNRGEMLYLDENLMALFRLAELCETVGAETDPCKAIVLVVESEGRRAGLMVDEILGQQQAVIKPIGECFKNIRGISGGAIMPDGRVGLILDVGNVIAMAISDKGRCAEPARSGKERVVREVRA
jgi:two-component system chemotaxis sensor kinase CheA